ncbi:DUF4226 domain-containing protein [Mycolicibacterium flavescens]|uniref:ESX-1 secretion-associated protein EspA/EspE-like domain-containing protein n=1 Tax=Mycolicibacterium flavescens TaxID=1776 RepID=A0A1E3RJM9_MYCFV|nr:EspA/EspE family type VII secretion system effector [Mycolicibacterium flavescens]MCV7280537.1 DUF4226 domain-containing protein [Mycolicibacterium flavescens]ODQ90073.1 hypothetical protein BHQ18_11530 [Mycolicibacterium flavescens]
MGVLEAFLTTWSQARVTFGEGVPRGGAGIDDSARLESLRSDVESAAPAAEWSGIGAQRYAQRNARQASALGVMADLDKRLAGEVDRAAAVVTAGRTQLEAVRQWVVDAAATVPRTLAGERMLWPLVSRGAVEVAEIVGRSNRDLAAIAQRMRGIGSEYDELGEPEDKSDVQLVDHHTDEKRPIPDSTLDLADIVYKDPAELGDFGMMELVPHSGVWVPDPRSRVYQAKPPKAPLDLNDIVYRGPGAKGEPWEMELVPGSGAWVPDPNHPGYQPSIPEAPVDLGKIEIVDPEATIPADMIELWPRSGVLIPNPYAGHPF